MPLTVVQIKAANDGILGDGRGLAPHKKGSGGKWIYRYSFGGKRREMGLGAYPTVGLADARKERDRWALVLSQGKDPISVREAEKAAILAEQSRRDPTLKQLAEECFEVYKVELRKGGASGRWMSPLVTHIFPKIGNRRVSTLTVEDVRFALAPIWTTKHPTAQKAIQRLGKVLIHGRHHGYECDPFIVQSAQHLLGHVAHKVEPTPSTHWQDIPELYRWLEGRGSSASCLQFMMLTLVRVTGCREARFEEFDGDVWTVPADRVKGREGIVKDFRVPLSGEALAIVERRRALGGDYVFPGYRGRPLSNSSMSKFLRDNGIEGKPHGFRASFRTWVQDNDTASWDVAETVLGHSIGGKTERAYARSDLLERRRPVMQAWAEYVAGRSDARPSSEVL